MQTQGGEPQRQRGVTVPGPSAVWRSLNTAPAPWSIIGAIVGAVGVVTILWNSYVTSPWYSKALIAAALAIGLLLLIANFKRWSAWARSLTRPRPQQASVVGPRFFHVEGEISGGNLQMDGNQMIVGSPFPPVNALPPIPATMDLLADRAGQLDALCHELEQFAVTRRAEYDAYEVPFAWDPPHRKMSDQSRENQHEHDRETVRLYVQTFGARVSGLYRDIRQYGFPDERLEIDRKSVV